MKKIILASTSPRRKQLLEMTGLKFSVEASDYKEDMSLKLKPIELAKKLSRGKAEAVAKKHKNAIVIGADTFIAFDGKVLGKPHAPAAARKMLKEISGRSHEVITGFTVINTATGKSISKATSSKIYFKKLSPKTINSYVRTGEPLDKGGSYAIQGLGCLLIDKIEGDYLNIIGLPTKDVLEAVQKLGVRII